MHAEKRRHNSDIAFLFALLGLCFGSFGSVLITRMPQGQSICGRSGCPQCRKTLAPVDLVPVLSYLALRGRCRGCKKSIGLTYPVLELLSGVLFVVAWWLHQVWLPSLLLALVLWLLLVISIIDLQTQTISDALNIPLLLLGMLYSVVSGGLVWSGAAVGVAFFGALWLLSRGAWVGSGDILLAAGIGVTVGDWRQMVACLFLTYILGGTIVAVLLLLKKVQRGQHVAFGPLFALGALATVLLTQRIDVFFTLYLP